MTMPASALARAAARSLARPAAHRSAAPSGRRYSPSAAPFAGGATHPLAPFARIPPESEKLVEQMDAIWDDGVAPEVTLDFDCAHMSSGETLAMWLGGLGSFVALYQAVKLTDPASKNPAVNRKMNGVDEDHRKMGDWKRLTELEGTKE